MQDLTPVGLSEDGRRLLLVSPAGEEFAVPVDTRLRAALRGENARLGQLEMKMESALRPRDIQARIRAGESPEDVAAAAQTTVEAIMGFASPVLAERAHVAQTALKASVRRRSGESSSAGRTLGEAAELFFGDHKLHDEDVEWDAWRRPDGRWALVATYAVAGRAAHRRVHPRPARPLRRGRERRGQDPHRRAARAGGPAARRRAHGAQPSPELGALPGRAAPGRRRHRAGPRPRPGDRPPSEPVRAPAADGPRSTPSSTRPRPGADTADADWIASPPRRPRPTLPLTEDPMTEEQRDAGPGGRSSSRPAAARADGAKRHRPGADLADEATARARRRREEEPLLGAVLGRDHVRRRQERVTRPVGGVTARLPVSNIRRSRDRGGAAS